MVLKKLSPRKNQKKLSILKKSPSKTEKSIEGNSSAIGYVDTPMNSHLKEYQIKIISENKIANTVNSNAYSLQENTVNDLSKSETFNLKNSEIHLKSTLDLSVDNIQKICSQNLMINRELKIEESNLDNNRQDLFSIENMKNNINPSSSVDLLKTNVNEIENDFRNSKIMVNSIDQIQMNENYINSSIFDTQKNISSVKDKTEHVTNGTLISLSLSGQDQSEIKNKLSISSIRIFNSSTKISENPFDFLENKAFSIIETPKTPEIIKKSITTDDQLLSIIKRPKRKETKVKKELREGIFNSIEILSKREINLPNKKYFKFPFELSLINDDSPLSEKLKSTFTKAFTCAYSNYRRFGESFAVVLFNDIFVFSKQLKCTLGTSRLLKLNEIKFEEQQDHIIVSECDKALVSDIIMNTDIPKGKPLPFILSEFEFDNGIVYRTKFSRKAVVKVGQEIEYSYILSGPLYSSDFKLEEDYSINYH